MTEVSIFYNDNFQGGLKAVSKWNYRSLFSARFVMETVYVYKRY